MTREEKSVLVNQIAEKLKAKPNIYLADTGGLTVAEVNNLRRACFKAGVEMVVVKNTLLRKAMEQVGGNAYEGIYSALHHQSSVFFVNDDFKAPAKVLKAFKKGKDKPVMKGAYIDASVFLGEASLETLINLKITSGLTARGRLKDLAGRESERVWVCRRRDIHQQQ